MTFASCVTVDEEGNLHDIGLTGLYESLGWPEEDLVMFYWQSLGPCVSQAGLSQPRSGEDVAPMIQRGDSWDDKKGIAPVKSPSDCLIRCKHPSFRCSDFRARMKMTGGRHSGTEATAMLQWHFRR